jgi:hypothetical protein
MNRRLTGLLALLLFTVTGCPERKTTSTPGADARQQADRLKEANVTTSSEFAERNGTFDDYWFRGLAELNRYELTQARYGERHDGEAVFIFVTEPFLADEQVKHEFGDGSNAEQVLKLNAYRRFYTGVYPYTMMTSTFTPAKREGPPHKLTQTVQEWCGQVFAQMNLEPESTGYDVQTFSYFQKEGDRQFELPTTMLEDALFTQIRKDPESLPTGEVELLPGVVFLRLMHEPWEVTTANATLSDARNSEFSDRPVRTYTLEYPKYQRTLKIHFEDAFPHRIVGFEETYEALFNPEGGEPQRMTTTARLSKSIMLDYWNRHGNEDAVWRDALGLQY